MVIQCKYNLDGRCLCSNNNDTVEEFCRGYNWICTQTCTLQVSEYTGRDRDVYLRTCLKKIRQDGIGILCVRLMECGHRANSSKDQFAVMYDACIIRLVQLHARRCLVSDEEFCRAYEQARRLGIRMPGRSRKIYHRLKRK